MAGSGERVDLDLAVGFYRGWIEAWNSYDPARLRPLITEDFALTTPTSSVMGWEVTGADAAYRYMAFVVDAYPDLLWEQTGPPLLAVDRPRAGFT